MAVVAHAEGFACGWSCRLRVRSTSALPSPSVSSAAHDLEVLRSRDMTGALLPWGGAAALA
ncbi:hypothetical protein BKI49_32910 [Streptomyces sp. Tue6028]|nr:hypothetical protein BKI49_32910 [Streptomyces sp. Tue6028]